MPKTLIIAEKPSVARDIAQALGKVPKKGDWFENDSFVISSAVGHLVELFMPEDIDKKLGFWRLESLPIVPDKFQLKPIEKTKSKFQELKKLIHRKDIDLVVNACDAGREGELIFTYLFDLANGKKPVKRMWMSSMTPAGIREAYESLRDSEQVASLADAARCRSESDWLIGINGTRAITKRMFGSRGRRVATVGRVQTPTLAIVVERENAIRNFKPRDYWRILATFKVTQGVYEGIYQKPDYRKGDDPHDRPERLWDRPTAEEIVEALEKSDHALVTEEKKRTTQIAPRLYDLTTLQREANNRYGFPAGKTLRVAQALYERHKVLTYPRTDSRALPEDYPATCRDTLASLGDDYRRHARAVLENNWVKPNKRIFNNAQVSDHFAIIPTQETPRKLSSDEEKIYDMVTRRFLAVFHPVAEFDVTTRISRVEDHSFRTEGKVLAKPGWLAVYGKDAPVAGAGEPTLPPLSPDDGDPAQAFIVSTELREEQTKPPPRYTEATLLTAMETAGKLVEDDELAEAMKERGLGTPATRANIIDHLVHEKYLERNRREIVPTSKAESLLEFLQAVNVEALTSPAMTGDWEFKLRQIEEGRITRKAFMNEIEDLTRTIVDRAKSFSEDEDTGRKTDMVSPIDGAPMIETVRAYKSETGDLQIYKVMGNRRFEENEVRELLEKGKIGPLDDFRSKAGKPFSAMLRLNEETRKVEFVFDSNGSNGKDGDNRIDFSELEKIGTCPKCGGSVYEGPSSYLCENNASSDNKCGFRLGRQILRREISKDQVVKLLNNRKTDLLPNFWSNRSKKPFSAHLILKEDGDIGFEFPPRAKKETAKKSAKSQKSS